MSDEKKQELADARAAAALARKQAVEDAQLAEIASVWDRINESDRRIFDYIREEIQRRTDANDIKFLRKSRAIHFRQYRRHLTGESVITVEED